MSDFADAIKAAFDAEISLIFAELTRRYSSAEEPDAEAERDAERAIECARRALAFLLAKEPKE